MRIPAQIMPGLEPRGAKPESVLPIVLTVDDTDSPRDVIDALALTAFVAGRQPYAQTIDLNNVRDDATLLPRGVPVLRESASTGEHAYLAADEDWTLRVVRSPQAKNAVLLVTAVSAELGADILAQATDGVTEPPVADNAVTMGFWYMSEHGPRRNPRPITAQPWAEIRPNYAHDAVVQLDRLVRVDQEHVRGRLILLYGPPGTGKTTVLRALAHEWRDWCQFDGVLDPEALFSKPAYLIEVALNKAGDCTCPDKRHEKWRLLLLEDCDELIHSGAKQQTGQALSRLLNLTDGLLGQGRKVLVAITTNEDLARLHPAVVRPGRCLARIEVPALPYDEAAGWLGRSTGVPAGGATLAELYALRQDIDVVVEPEILTGQYL